MPKRLSLIIAAVLAIIAIFLVKVYLDRQRYIIAVKTKEVFTEQARKSQESQTAVLVAKQDIPAGTAMDTTMIEVAMIPKQFVEPRVATSFDRIIDMTTTAPISQGEQISLNKLTRKQQQTGFSLAMSTPIGKRAITIPVDNISSVGGMIRPGDYVDVLCSIPTPVRTLAGENKTQEAILPLFQNVLILAVGTDLNVEEPEEERGKKKTTTSSPIITLALKPQEANMIAFVQEQGKIRLVLRSPADSQTQPIQPISWDTLFRYLMPVEQLEDLQKDVEEKKEIRKQVEIYRGSIREVVPLSQE